MENIFGAKLKIMIPIVHAEEIAVLVFNFCLNVKDIQEIEHNVKTYSFHLNFLQLLPKQCANPLIQAVLSQVVKAIEVIDLDTFIIPVVDFIENFLQIRYLGTPEGRALSYRVSLHLSQILLVPRLFPHH